MSLTRNLGNLSDILTAGSSYATQATPPQFDNSTNLATTAFVQRALGNLGLSPVSISANTTLTAAQSGSIFEVSANVTITLPNTPTLGLTYTFIQNASTGYTIAAGTSGTVWLNGSGGAASIAAPAGGALTVWSDGYNWIVPEFSGFANTPAQFDNTTRTATTAFVQRALGNLTGVNVVSSTATLTPAQAGSLIELGGTTSFTVTLPTVASVPTGATYYIYNASSSVSNTLTLAAQGTSNFSGLASGGTPTSYVIPYQSLLTVTSDGVNWIVSGQTFGASGISKAANGYQKLPSGILIQWGSVSVTGNQAVVFPLAFTTSVYSVTITPNAVASILAVDGTTLNTLTGFTIYNYTSSTGAATTSSLNNCWVAIGV